MMKIKEIIVVEGKHDSANLKKYFKCQTLETGGSLLKKDTLDLIEKFQKTCGVILFLDPDSVGEKIRAKINERIPNLKNAYILKEEAKTSKKVGVEHASYDSLLKSLKNLITNDISDISLSYEDYLDLGLLGGFDSQLKREKVYKSFGVGKCNGKTLYKRLLMKKITREDLVKIL